MFILFFFVNLHVILQYMYVLKCWNGWFCLYFSLDPENKEQLVEVIEKLLADKTTVSFKYVDIWGKMFKFSYFLQIFVSFYFKLCL
jgi:hypothetical protein